ncbi:curli assembly protein CsgF [Flavobacteriaceae bacterium AU392]|nr:curli assembly protein CsgF [Flavobacteriaceae bacterium]RKM81247.1 curli assembly protein CsgF [Flavobacteriaceae bacterium AU392]
MKKIVLLIIFGFAMSQAFSQKLVYRAVNPNFGGDTFNFQFLLQSAQAQNSFTDPNQVDPLNQQQSELDQFTQNLNNQLLNQISRSLLVNQFGANGELQVGTFSFGSLVVEVFPSDQGLVIDILDTLTGDQTQITVPN